MSNLFPLAVLIPGTAMGTLLQPKQISPDRCTENNKQRPSAHIPPFAAFCRSSLFTAAAHGLHRILQIGRDDDAGPHRVVTGMQQIMVGDAGLFPVSGRVTGKIGNDLQHRVIIADHMAEVGHPCRRQPDNVAADGFQAGSSLQLVQGGLPEMGAVFPQPEGIDKDMRGGQAFKSFRLVMAISSSSKVPMPPIL